MNLEHIVLLGDSIFDNAPYVPAGTEVLAELQRREGTSGIVEKASRSN